MASNPHEKGDLHPTLSCELASLKHYCPFSFLSAHFGLSVSSALNLRDAQGKSSLEQ